MTTDATLDYNSPYLTNLRSTAWWLYIFHAVCFLFTLGIFSFGTTDPELSGPSESDSHLALYTPDMADPFVLVVFRLGCSGLDFLFHDHRHDICRSGMGSGMVLVHLSPYQGFSVPE